MSDALVSGIRSAGYEVLAASSAEEGFFLVHERTARPLAPRPDAAASQWPRCPSTDSQGRNRHPRIDSDLAQYCRLTGLKAYVRARTITSASLSPSLNYSPRMDALLRRFLPPTAPAPLKVGDLSLDPKKRMACRAGELLDLTPREFDLLLLPSGKRWSHRLSRDVG